MKHIAFGQPEVIVTGYRKYTAWLTAKPELLKVARVHFCKEPIMSLHFGGWAVQKMSPFLEPINKHILLLDQVYF